MPKKKPDQYQGIIERNTAEIAAKILAELCRERDKRIEELKKEKTDGGNLQT